MAEQPSAAIGTVIRAILAAGSRDDLHRIQAPTLIVWGDRDRCFAREEQDRLRDGIRRARLRVYRGTGHAPHWEEPARFVEDLRAFVERVRLEPPLPSRT